MKTLLVRHVLPVVLLAAVALPQAARAQDDGASFEQRLIRNLLGGVGLIEEPKPPIDYRERAPLVVPPSTEALPAPRAEDAVAGNPAWPRDPDVVRAKAGDGEAGQPIMRLDPGRTLGVDEIRRGKARQARSDRPDLSSERFEGANERLTPGQLGFSGWGKKDEKIAFTGEPERTRLTQPPTGLLTPSPDQPYGVVGDEKVDDNWLNRLFSPSKVAQGRDSGGDRTARDSAR